jgi:hypothetical protein
MSPSSVAFSNILIREPKGQKRQGLVLLCAVWSHTSSYLWVLISITASIRGC